MRKYRGYTEEELIQYCKEVTSLGQLLKKLNLKTAGGNYDTMKRQIDRLSIDTSHWKGQGWSKGDQLKDWSQYKRGSNLKPHLIKERGHKCERCNLSEWMNEVIVLEIDHIDGNNTNNSYDNLRLLCCNCHSQTSTWRNRKRK